VGGKKPSLYALTEVQLFSFGYYGKDKNFLQAGLDEILFNPHKVVPSV
jgi:hypothetical protein